ncbi:MAG TPA: GGDEF domain-containing protein [Thermoanaerobaculia bacterium]|nr:GGDEF domain-containing protein [Thermoanaerobaculia bacterium]
MTWSPLDLRSAVFLIAVGNALAAAGLALYRGTTGVSRTYIVARHCQSAGWFLIWQIGNTPLWLNYLAANLLLQLGLTLEALAVMSVTRRRRKVEIFYAIWFAMIVAGTAYRYFVPFTAAELNRVNIEASFYAMVIFAVPAMLKGRGATGSRFKRVLAVLYGAFSLTLLARILMLLQAREPVPLFAPNLVQTLLFVTVFAVLLFATLAYVLLLTERTVQHLQASEESARRLADDVSALNQRLHEEAIRDPLTGLYNRRYLQESLARDAAIALRSGVPLLVAMLDVDEFKEVNDRGGHEAGDALLCEIASRLSAQIRSSDMVCRMGGDEFLVVLRSADPPAAISLCERWRTSLPAGTTVSIGLAVHRAGEETIEETIRRADAALYDAKRKGRNRVVVAVAVAAC